MFHLPVCLYCSLAFSSASKIFSLLAFIKWLLLLFLAISISFLLNSSDSPEITIALGISEAFSLC